MTIVTSPKLNTFKIFQMKELTKEEIEQYAPEFISDGEIDYKKITKFLFQELKRVILIAERNKYELGSR